MAQTNEVDGAIPVGTSSCFISYSTKDQAFADRLYNDLRHIGVDCWFSGHDIRGGEKVHEQIGEAIRKYDRLLLILSDNSMSSEWVKSEIAHARQRELRENRRVLFPISIVPFATIRNWECFDADTGKDSAKEIREYYIPDFSSWRDCDSYQIAFSRLVRDLHTIPYDKIETRFFATTPVDDRRIFTQEEQTLLAKSLALRENEYHAWVSARAICLLLVLEVSPANETITDEQRGWARRETYKRLTPLVPESDALPLSENTPAQDLLNPIQRMLRQHHPGRVENAFLLGMLAQMFLQRFDVTSVGSNLRAFGMYGRSIWTEQGILLPPQDAVRTAARTLFEHALRAVIPPDSILNSAVETLDRYYSEPATARGLSNA